jgi:chemotaxis protein histidine kinase CheA
VKPARGVSGGAILGDGLVALILDVGGLINDAVKQTRAEPAHEEEVSDDPNVHDRH